jgi:hypothetical protein
VSPQPFSGALGAGFNEPASSDPTSAPPENVSPSPVATALGNKKKKKGFGPGVKNPADLGRAIAMAKRARQGGHKYG